MADAEVGGQLAHQPSPIPEKNEKDAVLTVDSSRDVILIDWEENDPENPFNWSLGRKYVTLLITCFISYLTALNATSMAIMATWGPAWFSCSREMFVLGLTLYNCAAALTPLVLAPLSENMGRSEIYQVTSFLVVVLFIPQILSHNISGFLAARWFQGMVSSVGISMVGGTVADMFRATERGIPMNIFSLVNFVGQASGGLIMGWVGQRGGIRWCYITQCIMAAVSVVLNVCVLRETRAEKLLSGRAAKLTKSTGIKHVCKADLRQHKSFWALLRVSALRPLQFLAGEPIVGALSLWVGFSFGVIYLGGTATILVFRQYGFSDGQTGSVQACIGVGALIGFCTNFHQEALYRRAARRSPSGRAPPEARLYWAAVGGVLFPLGMMVFAWTGRPDIHWIVPAIMLCISYWGTYCMYCGLFNYFADAYETYSSSAQAAQSLSRNMMAGIFPLFAHQMYTKMGYAHASTVVAAIAFALAVAPFLLIRYGAALRARSPFTSSLVHD